ncbi:MAG TPA: hypothetical protein VKR06_29220 [Ktedonosporobacter sp.]|nr:hypothetical protein [Ktedonosporobacter sp.]
MTPISQMDCCTMLGIDPKTLRNWLRRASMQFVAHPTDARLKCLTVEQVQHLADLHARPLQMSPAASPAPQEEAAPLASSLEQAPAPRENEDQLVSAPPSLSEEVELRKAVSGLEAKVRTLQEHLTQLTLELLQERRLAYEHRLSALETLLSQTPLPPASPSVAPAPIGERSWQAISGPGRPLLPVELQARSRVLPRIEYGVQGTYVLVCPEAGELSLSPDSPEWFDWLATLSSFRFVGQLGRFTANRESDRRGPTRSWRAHRCIHGLHYRHYLGTTDHLTIACLEQAAMKLQSHLTSL